LFFYYKMIKILKYFSKIQNNNSIKNIL